MRKKPRKRATFRPLFSVLAVIFGLVLVGPISPANADSGTCDVSGGYVKLDGSSGSFSDVWGSMQWDNGDLHYTVNDGYTVKFCTKAGSDVSCPSGDVTETGPVAGPAEDDLLTCVGGNDQNKDISHVGYALVDTPTPEDASADVVITDATCDTGQTASQGGTTHASWDPVADAVEGPGSYSFTATADDGHAFPGGDTSETLTGDLDGPLTGKDCTEQPEPTTRTEPHSEEGCDVGGVHTWDVLFTTTYSWDEATGQYVGTEDGGVIENDVLTPYTTSELETLGCVEVEGEQGHSGHGGKKHPEVKGEQAHAPQVVPSQVEAGLAGTPAGAPSGGGSSLPLWALTVGAGLFLTGASRMRRTGRIPR